MGPVVVYLRAVVVGVHGVGGGGGGCGVAEYHDVAVFDPGFVVHVEERGEAVDACEVG